jgi:hypothetical protein
LPSPKAASQKFRGRRQCRGAKLKNPCWKAIIRERADYTAPALAARAIAGCSRTSRIFPASERTSVTTGTSDVSDMGFSGKPIAFRRRKRNRPDSGDTHFQEATCAESLCLQGIDAFLAAPSARDLRECRPLFFLDSAEDRLRHSA